MCSVCIIINLLTNLILAETYRSPSYQYLVNSDILGILNILADVAFVPFYLQSINSLYNNSLTKMNSLPRSSTLTRYIVSTFYKHMYTSSITEVMKSSGMFVTGTNDISVMSSASTQDKYVHR